MWHLHGYSLCFDIYFSSLRLRIISAPYFPTVPLSTSRKYACLLFKAAVLDLKKMLNAPDVQIFLITSSYVKNCF